MKNKGTRAERELLHMFWNNNWACIRVAGSGSMPLPSPDLIAGNKDNLLAIECKSIKNNSKNFQKEEIEQLTTFSDILGAEAIIAMRFDNIGWHFLNAKELPKNKNGNYTVTLKLSQSKGIKFEELIKQFKQLKL
ncbi:Holliday junction resolvase [Candidatus Woesearchaeota archaeon]|nr:Holliday junction resolvase [Candidatus Woesearchaeota archaeon]